MKRFLMMGLACSLVLAGCGGGGDGDDSAGSGGAAEGAYFGTTSNGFSTLGLVLDNGSYWFIYRTGSAIGGGVQGTGTYGDGRFTSSNGLDFDIGEDIYDVKVDAAVVTKTSLIGTLTYDDGSKIGFNTTYDSDYDLAPSPSALGGTYTGLAATSEGQEPANTTITSTGAVSGTSASGCRFSGSATPRSHGNVYDVAITFAGGVCTNGTDSVSGVAYYDAASRSLFSAAVNGGRSDGFIFIGTK